MKKVLTLALLLAPAVANAQDPWQINNQFGGTNVALGTKNLRETIGGIVNIILGFLGLLTTLIILWGGFKWMTSQGNADQVDQAKKIIGAGVIGLVVILTAYAISRYVLEQLYQQTV